MEIVICKSISRGQKYVQKRPVFNSMLKIVSAGESVVELFQSKLVPRAMRSKFESVGSAGLEREAAVLGTFCHAY